MESSPIELQRLIILLVPVGFWIGLAATNRQNGRHIAPPLQILSLLVTLSYLFLFNLVAVDLGYWSYSKIGAELWGLPVDLLLGWAIVWGPILSILLRYTTNFFLPLLTLMVGCFWIDMLVMPIVDSVTLNATWVEAEVAALLLVLLPAQILIWLTIRKKAIYVRAALQFIAFGILFYGVIPATIIPLEKVVLFEWTYWDAIALYLILTPAIQSVLTFARHNGTPYPYDSPVELVTTGWYQFLRNPMQKFVALSFVYLGMRMGEMVLLAIPFSALCFSLGIGQWHEDKLLSERFGERWSDYKKSRRLWVPLVFSRHREKGGKTIVSQFIHSWVRPWYI